MERLLVAGGLIVVAVAVALVLGRRRRDAPTQPDWTIPSVVDRADFDRPDAPWLVAVFTSATCESCHRVIEAARPLESDVVAVAEVEYSSQDDVHRRYDIDAVPLLLIADADGVVRGSFVGPVTAGELWAAVAGLRAGDDQLQPGSRDRRPEVGGRQLISVGGRSVLAGAKPPGS